MQKTMRAAVVRAFGEPLTIEEIPVPVPGPGEILVKVFACGVCHMTCMRRTETGRPSRTCRSCQGMRSRESSPRSDPASAG